MEEGALVHLSSQDLGQQNQCRQGKAPEGVSAIKLKLLALTSFFTLTFSHTKRFYKRLCSIKLQKYFNIWTLDSEFFSLCEFIVHSVSIANEASAFLLTDLTAGWDEVGCTLPLRNLRRLSGGHILHQSHICCYHTI